MSHKALIPLAAAIPAAVIAAKLSHGTLILWHIPAAVMAYLGFIACLIINIAITFQKKWSFRLAQHTCDVGLIFACVTIATGMVWAKQAWGTPWIWEPRITGMFLTTLLFLAWRLASHIIEKHVVAHRTTTATLIVMAMPAIAFTHLAGKLFGGIHPTQMPTTGLEATLSPAAFAAVVITYAAIATAYLIKVTAKKQQ